MGKLKKKVNRGNEKLTLRPLSKKKETPIEPAYTVGLIEMINGV